MDHETIIITPSVFYFGTPVTLVSTVMPDGKLTNITPISSAWALGDTYVLGLGAGSQAIQNLRVTPELVLNLPDRSLVSRIEAIAPTTGAVVIPAHKRGRYRHESDKWTLGGFTASPSELVRPARIAECPIQLEASVTRITPLDDDDTAAIVHAKVLRTHARPDIVLPGTSHINLETWHPVYYTFRHYYTQGPHLGASFKAEQ